MALDLALRGGEISTEKLQEGTLSCPVGPDKRYATVHVDPTVNFFVQRVLHFTRVGESDIIQCKYGVRQPVALREVKLEEALLLWLFDQAICFHLVQYLLLRLSLLHEVSVCSGRGNKLLDLLDISLLLLVLLHLIYLDFSFYLHERVIVTTVVFECFLRSDMADIRADAIEEVLRVRNEDEALVLAFSRKILLKPHARFEVQVIRRLIQKHERGLDEERLCKRDTHSPSPGHVLGGFSHHLVSKPETAEDPPSARLEGGGVQRLDAVIDVLKRGRVGPFLLEDLFRELLETFHLLLCLGDHDFHPREFGWLLLLGEEEKIHPVRNWHLTVGNALQELRLSTAVASDKTVSTSDGKLNVGVHDEFISP
mmetsp:Transcript_785/g.1183  ORF Transcript_785/g.1183 Transcript_785/m.1183 type:complete len:368 (-) Transcript_785:239-1342(-)